ncbi:hypothetical protein ABGT15_12320 [Flavobacterium enshiense]|uniref:hypothetical protein n=1 Tax=Flavobacterium enshiense TaxID=1341165 RepID=UPI00345DF58D
MNRFLEFIGKQSIIVFVLSLLVLTYWVITSLIDVYQYPVVGAIYELLWFPFLILFFALPITNLVMLVKNKFSYKKLWLYALLINGMTVFCLYKIVG